MWRVVYYNGKRYEVNHRTREVLVFQSRTFGQDDDFTGYWIKGEW